MEQPTYYDATTQISRTALCGVGRHGDCSYDQCGCSCHETKTEEE